MKKSNYTAAGIGVLAAVILSVTFLTKPVTSAAAPEPILAETAVIEAVHDNGEAFVDAVADAEAKIGRIAEYYEWTEWRAEDQQNIDAAMTAYFSLTEEQKAEVDGYFGTDAGSVIGAAQDWISVLSW